MNARTTSLPELQTHSSAARVATESVPRPISPKIEGHFHTCNPNKCASYPPVVNTVYTAVDNGISSPRFIRSSCYAFPCTASLAKDTGLPLAITVTPFADIEHGEESIPSVDFCHTEMQIQGPPRCQRCRAFVNPGVVFTENGHKWTCNVCGSALNETPKW